MRWFLILLAACSSREPRDLFASGNARHYIEEDPATKLPPHGVARHAFDLAEGLALPECVIHDRRHDVYLVSNMNGGPHDADDNGYISKVSPDGTLLVQKWIDGASPDVTLHAPRGMALDDTTLYVVDLDSVRLFDRETGKPTGTWAVPDPHFPNDVRIDDDGTLLLTETGIHLAPTGPIPEGDSVIWRFAKDGTPTAVARGPELLGPNGIAVTGDGIVIASFLGTDVYKVVDGHRAVIATLPHGELDGLVGLPDGSYLVTSWEANGVYRVFPSGRYYLAMHAGSMVGAASIEYDAEREQAIIPNALASSLDFEPFPLSETAPYAATPLSPSAAAMAPLPTDL